LNKLARDGLVLPGLKVGPYRTHWINTYTGEEVASGLITAHLQSDCGGWLRIQIGELDSGSTWWLSLARSGTPSLDLSLATVIGLAPVFFVDTGQYPAAIPGAFAEFLDRL